MKSKGCLTVTHWEKDNDLPMRRQIWKEMMWKPDADCYSKHSLLWSDLNEVIDQKLQRWGPTHEW